MPTGKAYGTDRNLTRGWLMKSSQTVRTIAAAVALVAATLLAAGPANAQVVKAASPGEGLLTSNQCSSPNADANTSAWDWTKPMLEISADNGATWTSAATYSNSGTKYAAQICRNLGGAGSSVSTQAYWFIIQQATGNDDMGQSVIDLGLQFKVTMPLKAGDTALRMTGYSKVVSYQPSAGSVVAIVKASPIAKVNMSGDQPFNTRHPECASVSDPNQCKVTQADRDIVGTVIQHIEFTTTAPTAWQNLSTGVWIGANVNGYQLAMTCATKGSDSSSGTSGGSGGSYSGSSDGGANKPSGSSGGTSSTSTPPSLSVTMSGTPHLRKDGTINKGNLQAFIPEATARACFGDGTETISLATIAQNMSVSRTESSENNGAAQDLAAGAYTASAVTAPVAGLLIDVAEMTFSNPTYKVSSKLAQQLLATYSAANNAGTTSGTTTNTTPAGSTPITGTYTTQNGLSTTVTTTVTMAAKVSGAKVSLTITVGKAQKIKVYKKVGAKLTLVKTLSAKVGPNTVSTAHKKGTTYMIKDATGKTLKSIKP